MTELDPTAEQVRDTVDRIVASTTFARSDRARSLLRYLVNEQLEGRGDRLKGFSIAVDVFGKDADYDSSTDAVVRVQAGRLRELLVQYFAGEGAEETIRIVIPRGSYIPSYESIEPSEPISDQAVSDEIVATKTSPARLQTRHAATPRRSPTRYFVRQVRLFWGAFGIVFAMLGFLAWNSWRDNALDITMAANAAPATRMADAAVSLPHVYLQVEEDLDAAKRVGAVLRTALTGFDTIVFIARPVSAPGDAAAQDFVFDVTAGPVEGSVNVSFENVRSGEVVGSRVLSAAALTPANIDDRIADLVTATIPVSGVLYAYLEAKELRRGLTRCLLLNDDYYLDQTAANHRAAYTCFEDLLNLGAYSPLIFSEMAALQLEAATDKYDYPPDASMENGLQMARRAVQMAPTSPYAHRAYGFLYTRMGITGESLKWTKRAYELGRYDMNMTAAYGYALIMAGQYEEGTPIMHRATSVTSARPSWWDYSLFLGAYTMGDTELAAEASDSLTAMRRPHYVAAKMIGANLRGRTQAVERARLDLIENHKAFVADPRSYYEKADYPDETIEKLIKGLHDLGIGPQT